jgi:hypothetical protein
MPAARFGPVANPDEATRALWAALHGAVLMEICLERVGVASGFTGQQATTRFNRPKNT